MSKMIQLRHVPDTLHRRLKARAALSGLPLSDYLIREVRKIAEYPSPEETYDAAYVTLAETLDAPLLTCDGKLARSHGHRAKIELIE
jgi:predicted nucleic acid-binding protein